MAGTKRGGILAAKTNKKMHGLDFYKKIGRLGGAKSKGGGFAQDLELARRAGMVGGKASKRKAKHKLDSSKH